MADGRATVGAVIPFIVMTAIWGIVGIIIPCFIKGPNKRLIQTMLVLTAVCCWLFWLLAYCSQLNPLQGPEIEVETLRKIIKEWGRGV